MLVAPPPPPTPRKVNTQLSTSRVRNTTSMFVACCLQDTSNYHTNTWLKNTLSNTLGNMTIVGGNNRQAARKYSKFTLMSSLLIMAFVFVMRGVYHSFRLISLQEQLIAGSEGGAMISHQQPAGKRALSAHNNANDRTNAQLGRSISDGVFVLNQDYISYLQTLGPFPKKLHILFPQKYYYKEAAHLPFVQKSILRFMELNPKWNVTVHDDADMDSIIERASCDGVISEEEKNILVGTDTIPAAHRK